MGNVIDIAQATTPSHCVAFTGRQQSAWTWCRNYGWLKDLKLKTLQPVPLPANVELAPETIMRMIRCACKSDNSCRTRACSCTRDGLKCTIFCACYAAGCMQPDSYLAFSFNWTTSQTYGLSDLMTRLLSSERGLCITNGNICDN